MVCQKSGLGSFATFGEFCPARLIDGYVTYKCFGELSLVEFRKGSEYGLWDQSCFEPRNGNGVWELQVMVQK